MLRRLKLLQLNRKQTPRRKAAFVDPGFILRHEPASHIGFHYLVFQLAYGIARAMAVIRKRVEVMYLKIDIIEIQLAESVTD